jgi:hypothetical protein
MKDNVRELEKAMDDIMGVLRVLDRPLIPSGRSTVRAMLSDACARVARVRDDLRTH